MVTLICTVRGCAHPLAREDRRLVCGEGHSFDIARKVRKDLVETTPPQLPRNVSALAHLLEERREGR